MSAAKRAGLPVEEAYTYATRGQVCDSYTSARGATSKRLVEVQLGLEDTPPNLRASTGHKRCAGCVHVQGAGHGLAHCQLYGSTVYPGVLWPHRTHDRHEWQHALLGDPDDPDAPIPPPEWRNAYLDEPSRVADVLGALLAALVDASEDPAGGERGQIAA